MNSVFPEVDGQAETLIAADGYRLTALRYPVPDTAVPRCGRILVGGATGVPQRFYRRFAMHAAAQGFETLTLDYRGVGLSKPQQLRGFEMPESVTLPRKARTHRVSADVRRAGY
jgi:predicted alpha/beta hydrolase